MAKEKKIAYLYLAGTVYDEQSKGMADYGIITKRQVVDFIQANKDADEFVVTIHSRGGDVTEGFAIYDALVASKKKITTIGEGLVASIATVFFMAGSTRKLTENTDFFIHNPWGEPWAMSGFTADDYEAMADDIRQAEEKILNFYVKKTGADKDLLSQYMKEETTIPSDEAVELKFATEIIETNSQAQTPKRNYRLVAYLGSTRAPNQTANKPVKKPDTMSKESKTILAELKKIASNISKAFKNEDAEDEGTQAAKVEITLDDDRVMTVEAAGETPAVGDMVTIDGETPEDGDYTEKDTETVYTIVSGAIDSITPKEDAPAEDAKASAAAKAKAAKDAKDPLKLSARITALEASEKKYKADLAKMKAENKKLSDEKKELENDLPEISKQLKAMSEKYNKLAKQTQSDGEGMDRDEDTSHHDEGEKTKGRATIADNAIKLKLANDKKKATASSAGSIWKKQ